MISFFRTKVSRNSRAGSFDICRVLRITLAHSLVIGRFDVLRKITLVEHIEDIENVHRAERVVLEHNLTCERASARVDEVRDFIEHADALSALVLFEGLDTLCIHALHLLTVSGRWRRS